VALYDIDGTATGSAVLSGPLAVFAAATGTVTGSASASTTPFVDHELLETLLGSAVVTASTQQVFDVSGFVVGQGLLIDARLLDLSGVALGSGIASASATRVIGLSGYTFGVSHVAFSVPEPIYGFAVVTAYMDVIHVKPPVCQTPQVSTKFRWGHTFTRGDLEICVVGAGGNPLGPVCMSYTLYKVVQGCQPIQVGPSGRKPARSGVGCYYVTGTAGECGQPGLWMVRWRYQRTFGDPVVEKDCHFLVLDSVLWPVPGDNLLRECKFGWGE
jgi:hypothetical protein